MPEVSLEVSERWNDEWFPEMERLFLEMPPEDRSPFNDPAYWKLCWLAFQKSCDQRCLRLMLGTHTLGFAAFRREVPLGIRNVHQATWLPITYLCAEFTSFLIDRAYRNQFWKTLSEYFTTTKVTCILHNLRPEDDAQLLAVNPCPPLLQSVTNPLCESHLVPFSTVLKKNSLQRHRKAISKLGILNADHYTMLPTLDLFERFVTLHIERWAYQGMPSLFARESYRNLYAQLLTCYAAHTITDFRAILTNVHLNGEPIAMHIGFLWNKRFLYQVPVMNLKYLLHWPGEILCYSLFRYALDHDCSCFDLGWGNEPYKARYSTTTLEYRTRSLGQPAAVKPLKKTILYRAFRSARSRIGKLRHALRPQAKAMNELWIYANSMAASVAPIAGRDQEVVLHLDFPEFVDFCREYRDAGISVHPLYVDRFKQGARFCVLLSHNRVRSWGWILRAEKLFVLEIQANLAVSKPVIWLIDFYTPPSERGQGCYTTLLKNLADRAEEPLLIYTTSNNVASQKGISRAGFQKLAERGTTGKRAWEECTAGGITFRCEPGDTNE